MGGRKERVREKGEREKKQQAAKNTNWGGDQS